MLQSEGEFRGEARRFACHARNAHIDIPFWSLRGFRFKFTFAALPTVFAATVVWGLLLGLLSALFGGSLLAFLVG